MSEKQSLPLWLIALGTGSAVMGITLITPALPVITQDIGALPDTVQLLLTVYLAMLAIGQLVYGPLSDVYGRRLFFTLGAFLIAIGGLMASFVSDISILILCRALQGLGAAACMSMGRAMLNDHFSKDDAAKAMATVQTIQAIVPMLGLSFGGMIVYLLGWQGVMGLITAAGSLLFLGALIALPETHPPSGKAVQLSKVIFGYKAVITNPLYVRFMMVSAMQVGGFFTLNAFIPYAYEAIGISTIAFGFYFGLAPVGYVTGNLFNRLYMVKKGIEIAALVGCLIATISMVLLIAVLVLGIASPIALTLPCALFGFGNGLTVANATIGGISAARPNAGTASGLIGAVTMFMGGAGGAIVIALGAADEGLIGAIFISVMVLFSLVCAISILRRQR